jgi:hypothetical protein
MGSRTIQFVRVLRCKGMKYGLAVDAEGNRWRGFFTKHSAEIVRQNGNLGPVGLCAVCGARVYNGWECKSLKQDACADCVTMPPNIPDASSEEYKAAEREFGDGTSQTN